LRCFLFRDFMYSSIRTQELSVMQTHLPQTISLLARTPATLNALLRDLPDSWTFSNEGEGTWTAFDIVGHLIHAEHTDWIPRATMILRSGESETFKPFNRMGQEENSRGKSLPQLLDEFAAVRSDSLSQLRALDLRSQDLQRRGHHPAFGPVTLGQLLATWAVHDLTHLHQLSRLMAHQYREAVGPWSVYLGVLQCAGHSSAA
jgi:DinB superfamily